MKSNYSQMFILRVRDGMEAALPENSMMYELAKALTGKTTVKDMGDAWKRYRQRELFGNLSMDDEQSVTVTTTTTMTTSNGTATITEQFIVRGMVYVKKEGAVAYIGQNRFDLKEGNVFWAGRKIGWYDRHGCGEINSKPIRIYRPDNQKHFVLAEVRKAA